MTLWPGTQQFGGPQTPYSQDIVPQIGEVRVGREEQIPQVPQLPLERSDVGLTRVESKHYNTPEPQQRQPGAEYGFDDYPEEIPADDILPYFQPQEQIERRSEVLADIRTSKSNRVETVGLVLGFVVVLFLVNQIK